MIYENAELEIVRFAAEDVLATSAAAAETTTVFNPTDENGDITTPDDDF